MTDFFTLKDLFETFELDSALEDHGPANFTVNQGARPISKEQTFVRHEKTSEWILLRS